MFRAAIVAIALSHSGCFALKTSSNAAWNNVAQKEAPQGDAHLAQAVAPPTLNHELPQSALRATAWVSKIPDIQVNLLLAQQWMTIGSSKANSSTKVSGGLLTGPTDNGVVVMAVGVKDAPKYYDCGLAMNTAWGAMARDPCSMSTWTSSESMKAMVPDCSKLRQGERYEASYRALKLDQDTWCGGPHCDPACAPGSKCFRGHIFPFSPECEGNRTVAEVAAEEPAKPPSNLLVKAMAAAMVLFCIGLALIPFRRTK